jgi:hypothetical protein
MVICIYIFSIRIKAFPQKDDKVDIKIIIREYSFKKRAHGSIVVEALCCKPEGHGIASG